MIKELDMAVNKTAVYLTGKTKEHINKGTDMWKAPVDTGAMRQGIQMRKGSRFGQAIVATSNRTPYAFFVHEGTRRMRKRPFFEVVKRRETSNAIRFFNKAINEAIK